MRGVEGTVRGLGVCAIYVSVTLMSSISGPILTSKKAYSMVCTHVLTHVVPFPYLGCKFLQGRTQIPLGCHVSTRVPDTQCVH